MSTDTGGRRTGAETRAEILRVALRLFTEKGFEGTSTRDISTALGITKSSLYYHFPNKEAIVVSLVAARREEVDELVDWIRAQPPGPDLLQRAALRWLDGTTAERLQAIRLRQANQPTINKLVNQGEDLRTAFERVVDALVDDGAARQQRLITRMAFLTVNAALDAAEGTDASPADIMAAARSATIALSAENTSAPTYD